MATKKTRPEHVETVDPESTPGVVDLTGADDPYVTVGEPTNQPVDGTANLTLSIAVPVEEGAGVDFGPLIAAVEKAISETWPGAMVEELPAPAGILEADEEIPPGHSARTIILSDEQWAAVDRQAKRGKSTGSQWLRRFLQPYLRRG